MHLYGFLFVFFVSTLMCVAYRENVCSVVNRYNVCIVQVQYVKGIFFGSVYVQCVYWLRTMYVLCRINVFSVQVQCVYWISTICVIYRVNVCSVQVQ